MNGTGSTRDQMRHIIYINIDKGNGEPSIYMFSHLPFHPLTLTISLPFPSLSLTSSPISHSIHFHFPHSISSPLNPFPIFPTLAAHSVYPLSFSTLPSFPLTHPTTAYNPYTPTLHPLPHVYPHPPILALVPTLYALVSTLSCCLTLPSYSIFHMKHNNNNSYFHFHIIYYILYII